MKESDEIKNRLLFKFNSGLALYLQGMSLCKQLIQDAIDNKNNNEAFVHFYHFLCDMFALRENVGIKDSIGRGLKEDSIYGALKNYYECIKHKNDYGKVQNINLFVSNASYPRIYPYNYGESYIRFQEMNEDIASLKCRDNKSKHYMIELHNKHLKDKKVLDILELCVNENTQLLKEKNNG